MKKTLKYLKRFLLVVLGLIVIIVGFGFWFMSLIPAIDPTLKDTKVSSLTYLSKNKIEYRGKILAVVTSMDSMGLSGKKTGYELTELSRAYYVFMANGFDVDIASPLGGKAPVVLDKEDMGAYDFAFMNDVNAQSKTENTLALETINPKDYEAIYFVGGKGAMYDFPNNKYIQRVVKDLYQSNKVVGAVCHGPASLVNVQLDNGHSILKNKRISSFTNSEELLLIPDAEDIFPFLLQDKLEEKGGVYNEGEIYLENVSHDGNLITGQNPWSTWGVAETMIQQMGYAPKFRPITPEENAVKVLLAYRKDGVDKAKELINELAVNQEKRLKRDLIARHSIVAIMNGDMGGFIDVLRLTSFAKTCEKNANKL